MGLCGGAVEAEVLSLLRILSRRITHSHTAAEVRGGEMGSELFLFYCFSLNLSFFITLSLSSSPLPLCSLQVSSVSCHVHSFFFLSRLSRLSF